jgi:uncharacterized protein (TIGR00730 family)
MGQVARAARDAGAPMIGILPSFLRYLEPPLSAEELVITPDLQQRKARMMALADGFVILPGGLGTMDEYFEAVSSAQLSVHNKPVVLVDVNNYFEPLESLIKHIVSHGFAKDLALSLHKIVDGPAAAIAMIEKHSHQPLGASAS